ncbi:hypothetical protein MKW94_014226 [Papaver nudicaule]|uniref:MI domain-containing protein n=1 Tax=Papaver nudicaule TaxID=74823 RepID=A0AA41RY82_PAPNU|nr:hypothetical protein [Papaver nudicaule]
MSINGLVNKVNTSNIKDVMPELSCMKSQMAAPGLTDIFAALSAVVNTKFPELGILLLKGLNDKPQLLAAAKFIAHLVNQQVAHEIIALELLTVLRETPTDDSVEVAVDFFTECGSFLQDLTPRGHVCIFDLFRGILLEGIIGKRKTEFQGHPAVRPELDLVEQENQLTHDSSLEDVQISLLMIDPILICVIQPWAVRMMKNQTEDDEQMKIQDGTEMNLVNLRRAIYLTFMSSVGFEEAGHELLKIKLEPGQERTTYRQNYGLLVQRLCMISKIHQENIEKCFVQQYSMVHRLETNKLPNVASIFAHLLGTDAFPCHVLAYVRLTEEDTTSSSRLGGITDNLREYLKTMPTLTMQQQKQGSEFEGESESELSSSESEMDIEQHLDKRRERY